jgi:tRNA-specific adenosine deaminase 1
MKCLPHAKLPNAQGNVLHDWHAEVLAIRAFNRFVLDEARALSDGTATSSAFLRRRDEDELQAAAGATGAPWAGQPFAWRDDVRLHMYCSEAPCGDASMELTMAAQDDASPWDVPAAVLSALPTPPGLSPSSLDPDSSDPNDKSSTDMPDMATATTSTTTTPMLPGRAYFSHLGLVRRKPARADAPPTLSKSCSDKLALRQCTSVVGGVASLVVAPAYLDGVILPVSQHSATGCERAFSARGRMGAYVDASRGSSSSSQDGGGGGSGGGYGFRAFTVKTTALEFAWSKRSIEARVGGDKARMAASNLAVAWTGHGLEEATLGGTLQGRKAFDPRGASFASRRRMWALATEVTGLLGDGMMEVQEVLSATRYVDVKRSRLSEARRRVKEDVTANALKGWARNEGDDGFSL